MLERLYVHNFRCLENFEFKPGEAASALLIGRNGAGKSTVAHALGVLQRIGRGVTRVGELVKVSDFAQGRSELPLRFAIQVTLAGQSYSYELALELPQRFKELRVLEEALHVDGQAVYTRQQAQVTMPRRDARAEAQFNIDWHVIALNVVQDGAVSTTLMHFRKWLGAMVLLAPVPSAIGGESQNESLEPASDARNLADWLAGLLAQYPAAYPEILSTLQEVMPDLHQFRNVPTGRDAKALTVDFRVPPAGRLELPFHALSDGEKCCFLSAVLLAANKAYGPLLAFWDEPDSHLSMSEVRQFAVALRRAFALHGGQIIVTSHNAETVRSFSDENTWVLVRESHLEPSVLRPLTEVRPKGDLVQAILTGELAS